MPRQNAAAVSPVLIAANQKIFKPFRLLRWVAEMRAAHRQRLALAAMEDHRLSDLGLNREAAEAEAARPIWDVPTNWRL